MLLFVRGEGLKSVPGYERVQNEPNKISQKVQVGKDQEKAQSEKDSHSKNREGKKLN